MLPITKEGEDVMLSLTPEEAEALRRATSQPDILSEWDAARDERLYQPLLARGFLVQELRESDPGYEIVHYETTEEGKYALFLYDRRKAQAQ